MASSSGNEGNFDPDLLLNVEVSIDTGERREIQNDSDSIQWIPSTHGKHPKLVHKNYIYHHQKASKKEGGGAFYICENAQKKGSEQCRARGVLRDGIFTPGPKPHIHRESCAKAEAYMVSKS